MAPALRLVRSRDRHRSAAILIAALVIASVIGLSPLGTWADRALAPLRFAAADRPASGQIVLVEMDAASVRAIRRWPWPRDHYARALDRLRRAGAQSITFDVDLSTPNTSAGDAAFARALERSAGLVTLPTFAQEAGSADARTIDTLPLPSFRRHVALASVSVAPDEDGMVRRAPLGTVTAGIPRPSVAALIAHRSGEADASFPIAFGIDPTTIPRLSFVAVRDGRFDAAQVRGRDVLIGATAIEMGDRYATPRWGVIPGVVIQALAAETLLSGVPQDGSAWWMLLLALAIGAGCLRLHRLDLALVAAVAAMPLLFAVAVLAQRYTPYRLPLVPAEVLVLTVAAIRITVHLIARFAHQRLTDETTQLPNRRALLASPMDAGATVATLLVGNLDALLSVLGTRAERDLVNRLAERLALAAGGATVHRISDRILALALPPGDNHAVLAARLRAVMLQPVEVAGRRVDPSCHLGLDSGGGGIEEQAVRAAQTAERAAAAGEFVCFDAIDHAVLEREVTLMGELDRALGAGEIEVHYQPKLALAENRVTGVEALVRWRHPDRGLIRPDLFIPLAEQTGRIGPLTLHMLKLVTDDLAKWQATGLALGAAINVSARLVTDEAFGAALHEAVAARRFTPSLLTIEVTESATLSDPLRAAESLRSFRALGCGVSMDDYGTGQSTLSYLQRLPLTELKIDRSFVQHAHAREADALMVRSTIDLAHGLGLKVVAEGIEEEACLRFLRAAGCDMAQGYWIGRPMRKAELLASLNMSAAA